MATTLKAGDKGELVKRLQAALISFGYDLGPSGADGRFGGRTKTAVESFQDAHGLPATGVADPDTIAAMDLDPDTLEEAGGHQGGEQVAASQGRPMAEIEMPPQYAGEYSDPHDTEGHVLRAVQTMATDRVNLWTTFVLNAVDEFESAANHHIEELEYNHDATYSFDPVLAAFASVVTNAFPPTAIATSGISTVMGGIQSSYEQKLQSGLTGAKLRLHGSVLALVQAARERATLAASIIHEHLPAAVEDGMTWVDSASTDPDYVSALCDWMGFPLPTRENTVNPVRQALENQFFGVYQAVRAQLLRTQGVPGLDDDDMIPHKWQREAVERQRELYRQEGPDAWEKSYDEIQ